MESYYKQNKKLITDILDILEGHFGKNVEFVVHDLSLDYEHTIVDIRNGEVTGRKVGGTGDLLGLRALRYNGSNEGNCFNTLTYAENGKILRSSVSAEVVSSFSAKQSSEHIAQSSEHEVANDDCNNIVHKHFLFYGLYTLI